MTRLLSLVGLMRVSEHEAVKLEADADKQLAMRLKAQLDTADCTIGKLYNERDDWKGKHASVCERLAAVEAKYKQAVADLEKQAGEIAELGKRLNEALCNNGDLAVMIGNLQDEVFDLRPDALAMRRKRQMDRDRRKGNG